MQTVKHQLHCIFEKLNQRVQQLNLERQKTGTVTFSQVEIKLLGQMSLLAHEEVSMLLTLTQTVDLDALLRMDHLVKEELKNILKSEGFIYDEDSPLIWIPPGANFDEIFFFQHVIVQAIDPESALVSKAVKAPKKNKQLIREALASGRFSYLADRILQAGGILEDFI